MGCGTSKEIPLSPFEKHGTESVFEKPEEIISVTSKKDEILKNNINSSPSIKREEKQSPIKQNGTGNLVYPKPFEIRGERVIKKLSEVNSRKGDTAVAFEVVDDSLIKKHPPKKFQKLEDMQGNNLALTPEELEKKQEIARKRRETLLSKRVQSAKERSAKSAHIRSNTDENDEDINDAIESPEDI